jgi:NAD(P)H-nitrite reductase large subunit
LKVAGVDVFAGGEAEPDEDDDEVCARDTRRGTYRRLVLRGDRLTGAVLVGDVRDARRCSELLRSGAPVPGDLLDGPAAQAGPAAAAEPDPAATVCSCNQVTAGTILRAIRDRDLTTVAGVSGATGASTGCGSCASEVGELLRRARSSTGNEGDALGKPPAPSMAP